jgi:hypothetical protein
MSDYRKTRTLKAGQLETRDANNVSGYFSKASSSSSWSVAPTPVMLESVELLTPGRALVNVIDEPLRKN